MALITPTSPFTSTTIQDTVTATTTTFSRQKQIGDQGSQGLILGTGPNDPAQYNNPGTQLFNQLAGPQCGTIMKYQIGVPANALTATSAGVAGTVQTSQVTTSLQPGVYFATNSVYAANKPTLQAGLGIGGLICATTGIMNINYLNLSTATITPTAEATDIIELKAGPLTTTAALTPANVAINTTAEQIFTITGNVCLPGTVAVVNKPTQQAGLAYSPFARVVGVNQVGITFGCVTSGAVTTGVTPTPAESYNLAFLPQLNAFNPTYIYGIPSGATATGNSTTLEQTSGVTGILLSDTISGVARGTTQPGVFIGSYRVTSAGVIGLNYGSVVTSSTPTTSEVLLATIQRQMPLNPMMIYSQALATSSIAATTSAEVTTTVTGLLVSSSVIVNKPSCTPGIMVTNARVSAANTLAVTYSNFTTTAITIPTETYTIGNVQLQGPGLGLTTTAGLFVAQSYYPAQQQALVLANSLRQALINIGAISGQ